MTDKTYDIRAIMDMIPHRYPFLLIDRVLECEADSHVVAIKNVSIGEPYFEGHFPGRPVMPGVLIIEALAQASGVLCYESTERPEPGTIYFFVGIDKARFRKPVVPGDQLRLEVHLDRKIRSMWRFSAKAYVDGDCVANADMMSALAK